MIIALLINILVGIFSILFGFFPVVTIADIPVIGESVSSILLQMVVMWNAFLLTFPYAQLPWNILLYVILPFEVLLLVFRFILGHRVPVSHAN